MRCVPHLVLEDRMVWWCNRSTVPVYCLTPGSRAQHRAGFSALCGVPADVLSSKSEFWVLIDGECVFHYDRRSSEDQSKKIDIPLASDNHFLTLAATDGGDKIGLDWCVFANPSIDFEAVPIQ